MSLWFGKDLECLNATLWDILGDILINVKILGSGVHSLDTQQIRDEWIALSFKQHTSIPQNEVAQEGKHLGGFPVNIHVYELCIMCLIKCHPQ